LYTTRYMRKGKRCGWPCSEWLQLVRLFLCSGAR